MISFEPNYKDPRTQKRLRKAIGFASSCMSANKPRSWSSRELDRWIGYTHKPLGRYLRDRLLITHDDYYQWGVGGSKCKTYRLNTRGVHTARVDQRYIPRNCVRQLRIQRKKQ